MVKKEQIALVYNDQRGLALAKLLLESGYKLVCVEAIPGKAILAEAIPEAAILVDTISKATKGSSVIITVLDSLQADEDVYMDSNGLLLVAEPGSLLLDFSVTTPTAAKELHALSAVHDLHYLECTNIGTQKNWSEATLRLLVAGEEADFTKAESVLSALSKDLKYVGNAGNAVTAKLCLMMSLASSLAGLVEAFAFAKANNVDKNTILSLLTSENSAVKSIADAFGGSIITESFKKHLAASSFVSDLELALEAAEEVSLTLPSLETTVRLYGLLQMISDEDLDLTALALDYYDEVDSERLGLDWSQTEDEMEDEFDEF
jgi:3-hydroxyisobutyrate dehydrogenase